ncbi:phage tail terminator protein [Paraburkholderia strydomiana]
MNLNAVIEHLRERVPLFDQRVAGAAKFSILPEGANLLVPAAYVIPRSTRIPISSKAATAISRPSKTGLRWWWC